MPAGAMPVPKDSNGTRELAGWLFHYDGHHPDVKQRSVPVRDSVVPPQDVTKFDIPIIMYHHKKKVWSMPNIP